MTTQTIHSIILVVLAVTVLLLGTINTISTRALGNIIDRVKVLEDKVDVLRANVLILYEINKDEMDRRMAEKGVQLNDNSTKP